MLGDQIISSDYVMYNIVYSIVLIYIHIRVVLGVEPAKLAPDEDSLNQVVVHQCCGTNSFK
jgi:hypothetical protein